MWWNNVVHTHICVEHVKYCLLYHMCFDMKGYHNLIYVY